MILPNIKPMPLLTRLLLALLIAAASVASAQERPARQGAQQTEQQQSEHRPSESVLRLLPVDSVTEHSVDVPGGKLTYAATAGTLSLFDQSGERSAAIYYTSYMARGGDASGRPIT